METIIRLRGITQGSYEWDSTRWFRISGNSFRRSVSENEIILDYINNDRSYDNTSYSALVEDAIKLLFFKHLQSTGIWIDPKDKWLCVSPDATFFHNNYCIPVEIKSKSSKKPIEEYLKNHYFQIQLQMHILETSICLFIVYNPLENSLQFYEVEKSEVFSSYYLHKARNCFYKHILKDACPRHIKEIYEDVQKTKLFKNYFPLYRQYCNIKGRGCLS